MSNPQRIILLVGALIAACVFLRLAHLWEQTTYVLNPDTEAPHRAGVEDIAAGHHWIWAPPEGWVKEEESSYSGAIRRTIRVLRIDWERTGVYAGVAVVVCAMAAFAAGARRKREVI
jgi:hypothetical protein